MQHEISVPTELLADLLLRAAHASRLLGFCDGETINLAIETATEHVDHVGRTLAGLLGVGHAFGDAPTNLSRCLTPARGISSTPTQDGIPDESVPVAPTPIAAIAPRHTMRYASRVRIPLIRDTAVNIVEPIAHSDDEQTIVSVQPRTRRARATDIGPTAVPNVPMLTLIESGEL